MAWQKAQEVSDYVWGLLLEHFWMRVEEISNEQDPTNLQTLP